MRLPAQAVKNIAQSLKFPLQWLMRTVGEKVCAREGRLSFHLPYVNDGRE